MHDKIYNYILIILIICVLLFFFQTYIHKVIGKIKDTLISLVPDMNFIYV